jgi:ATP-dependent DNA ligase
MAARVVDKLPEGDEWMCEVKFDGYGAAADERHVGDITDFYARSGPGRVGHSAARG